MSNSSIQPTEYLLLFRGNDWPGSLSADELQNVMSKWRDWFGRLSAEGKMKAGQPLGSEGRLVSGKNGRNVADGPFAESKEAIGGYFLIEAESLDEAIAIAQQCPGLNYGTTVEVRPIAEECPLAESARRKGINVETLAAAVA
jgi:hypothetical protein